MAELPPFVPAITCDGDVSEFRKFGTLKVGGSRYGLASLPDRGTQRGHRRQRAVALDGPLPGSRAG